MRPNDPEDCYNLQFHKHPKPVYVPVCWGTGHMQLSGYTHTHSCTQHIRGVSVLSQSRCQLLQLPQTALLCLCLLPHCGLLAGSSPFRGCRGVSETIVTKSRHYRTHTCHSLPRGGQGCSQDIFSTEAKI